MDTNKHSIFCGSDSKASDYNAVDLGSVPRSGRSPGEGNGNPYIYIKRYYIYVYMYKELSTVFHRVVFTN